MHKTTPLDRVLVLLAVVLASYQVVVGIDGLSSFAVACYTVGFGALLVAGLLVIILGLEILDSPYVASVSTIIPLSLSAGLVAEFFPALATVSAAGALAAFLAVAVTRFRGSGRLALSVLAVTHALSGMVIFLLPLVVSVLGRAPLRFGLVGVGGALIGAYGLLLSFMKTDSPAGREGWAWRWFSPVLLLATAAFVYGFTAL